LHLAPVAACLPSFPTPRSSDLASFVSPPYDAVSECDPAASVDTPSVAVPLLTALVPNRFDPSLNVTVPVAVEGETVAVRTTFWLDVEGIGVELSYVLVASSVSG